LFLKVLYQIQLEDKAFKALGKLDRPIRQRIFDYLEEISLSQNPKLFGKPLLFEKRGNWRYRVGDYRIICRFKDRELVILVIDVGHRKEIYN
jgi:mRNA interferase RelE/StbE